MITAVSADFSQSEAASTAETLPHWLHGIYFVPSPDISDETRWAINKGRAMPLWEGLMALLHNLERKGSTEAIRAAARAGRIEHMGVNGIAKAIHMTPAAVLRQMRHLEQTVGIVATDQRDYTLEKNPVTGRIIRNYAKAEPKTVTVTVKQNHLRPGRAVQSQRPGTHETALGSSAGTHETALERMNPQGGNRRVSKERTSKEVRSFGTNRRPIAAGPQGRPASTSAKASPQSPPDWQRQAEEEQRQRDRQRVAEFMAHGTGMPVIEVAALWKADPDELKRRCVTAGIMTPEGRFIRERTLNARDTVCRSRSTQEGHEVAA